MKLTTIRGRGQGGKGRGKEGRVGRETERGEEGKEGIANGVTSRSRQFNEGLFVAFHM